MKEWRYLAGSFNLTDHGSLKLIPQWTVTLSVCNSATSMDRNFLTNQLLLYVILTFVSSSNVLNIDNTGL